MHRSPNGILHSPLDDSPFVNKKNITIVPCDGDDHPPRLVRMYPGHDRIDADAHDSFVNNEWRVLVVG